jgi:hypothetical protein
MRRFLGILIILTAAMLTAAVIQLAALLFLPDGSEVNYFEPLMRDYFGWAASRSGEPGTVPEAPRQKSSGGMDFSEKGAKSEEEPIQPEAVAEPDDAPMEPQEKDMDEESLKYYMTREEVFSLENASLPDKFECFRIVARLGREELQSIYSVIRDGVTIDEMTGIREALSRQLEPCEIEKLEGLLQKNRRLYAEGKLAGN